MAEATIFANADAVAGATRVFESSMGCMGRNDSMFANEKWRMLAMAAVADCGACCCAAAAACITASCCCVGLPWLWMRC